MCAKNINIKYLIKVLGFAACILFLFLQVILIFSSRTIDNRYFIWAPHDIQTEYYIVIRHDNKELKNNELKLYYGLGKHGWVDLPADYLKRWIIAFNRQNQSKTKITASLDYCTNGREWKTWQFNNLTPENN